MKTNHTQEEVKQYFHNLRKEWQQAKEMSKKEEFKAAYIEATANGLQVSITGWIFCKIQMEAQGLEGTPYIDTKTFNGWKSSGFKVKKGEKSKIHGLTWLQSQKQKDNEEEEKFMFPKAYALFHKSQVEETNPEQKQRSYEEQYKNINIVDKYVSELGV